MNDIENKCFLLRQINVATDQKEYVESCFCDEFIVFSFRNCEHFWWFRISLQMNKIQGNYYQKRRSTFSISLHHINPVHRNNNPLFFFPYMLQASREILITVYFLVSPKHQCKISFQCTQR